MLDGRLGRVEILEKDLDLDGGAFSVGHGRKLFVALLFVVCCLLFWVLLHTYINTSARALFWREPTVISE